MSASPAVAVPVHAAAEVLPLREQYRQELNCQIVHDSIHRRAGWTATYLLTVDDVTAGFGSIAIAGPWVDKPTIFEFFVLPEHRSRAFDLFEALMTGSGARFMEVQSSDALLSAMLHVYARDIVSEAIVFHDRLTTTLPSRGAELRCEMSEPAIRHWMEARDGGPEWQLTLDGTTVATGGILFHYNRPYGDIYMEVVEGHRGRGFGSYLVQELKRIAYELGAIPGARCNPRNVASRKTLQKAGFVPCAHILDGTIARG
jgi:GNAT superfamily N-acetyltransferase